MPTPTPTPQNPQQLINAVLAAYSQGHFPMADPDDPTDQLGWYDPDPRALIPLSLDTDPNPSQPTFHIPRRLLTRLRTSPFITTTDTAFAQVIRACAEPRREGIWIDQRIVTLFELLHDQGHAHSIEVWLPNSQSNTPPDPPDPFDPTNPRPINPATTLPKNATLVGGLYGLSIGSLFAGESMFSHPALGGTDASKVALTRTVFHLRHQGFTLFDCQFWNEHLEQFGCHELPRNQYRKLLAKAITHPTRWTNS